MTAHLGTSAYFLAWIGNGTVSHAYAPGYGVTLCGRPLSGARELVQDAGGEPGCHACYRLASDSGTVDRDTSDNRATTEPRK